MLRFCCKLNIKISRSNHLNVEILLSLSHITASVSHLTLFGILDAALISTQPYHCYACIWLLSLFSIQYSWYSNGMIPSQRLFTYLNGRSVVFENGSAHIHNTEVSVARDFVGGGCAREFLPKAGNRVCDRFKTKVTIDIRLTYLTLRSEV